MPFRRAAICLLTPVLVGAWATTFARAGDGSVKNGLAAGVRQINATHDYGTLHGQLVRLAARLGRDRGSTPAGERGRRVALAGFRATLTGLESRIDFVANDSGNVAAATRDATRADRYLKLGADRLRAAGRALGVPVALVR